MISLIPNEITTFKINETNTISVFEKSIGTTKDGDRCFSPGGVGRGHGGGIGGWWQGLDHGTTTSLGGADEGVARRRIGRFRSPMVGEHAGAGTAPEGRVAEDSDGGHGRRGLQRAGV
jgi:hypothetical protein